MEIGRGALLVVLISALPAVAHAEDPTTGPGTEKPTGQADAKRPASEQSASSAARTNPIDDYTLAALSKLGEGWYVILLHKENRAKRIRLRPNQESSSGFKVLAVENPSGRDARVQLEADGQTGWVTFEPKYLTVHKVVPEVPLDRNYRINLDDLRNRVTKTPAPPNVRRTPESPSPDPDR